MIQLPRLYVNGKFSRIIHPASVSITQNIKPLSSATIKVPRDDEIPARSWLELFTPYGSAGIFRVRSPHTSYVDDYSTAELEHMIAEVGDYLVKEEIKEMMPATSAIKRIFSHYKGGKWTLGNYSAVGNKNIAVECNYDSVLTSLLSVLEQKPDCMMSFDFSTTPWTLNIVKIGTSVVSEGRLSRNVTSATASYDDSELVTRLWYQVFDKQKDSKGNEKVVGRWLSKDANVSKYGVFEDKVSTSSDMTAEEINATVDAYLEAHKNPRASVKITAEELFRITGERRDKFLIGDLFRLAIPEYSVTVELNITSITWNDVYGNPDVAEISLGEEEDTVVTFLHNLDSKGSGSKGGSGGGKSKKDDEVKWKEYFTTIEQTDYAIKLQATKVDRADNILEQAGMGLDSKGVLIYARDKTTNIKSMIDVQSSRIDLVVKGTGKNATINAAKIVMGINEDKESYIKIKATKVELSGYVTIDQLASTNATINNLISGNTVATYLNCQSFRVGASTWRYGTSVVSKKTATISGTTIKYLAWTD